MKNKSTCKVCGKRAKSWALKNKQVLCMKHYNELVPPVVDANKTAR